jgi:hypothetical protein
MRPIISEFSYGYSVTDELIHHHGLPIVAAPVFPSLFAEGRGGGGWDVKLQVPSLALFLQFKLSHKMVKGTASEYADGHISTLPFFRMHIWSRRTSKQQDLLMDLEDVGELVYYVAPQFFTDSEQNDAYLTHNVINRSRFFRPSLIGRLTDDSEHWIAFSDSSTWVCSTPKPIRQRTDWQSLLGRLDGELSTPAGRLDIERLQVIRDSMINIVARRSVESSDLLERLQSESPLGDDAVSPTIEPLLHQVSYIAKAFFDCEMVVVSPRQK